MQTLDSTIVATALPKMAEDFGEPPVRMSLVIVAYLLVGTIFIPVSTWVADRVGANVAFCGSIVVFTIASLLCGLSQTLWQLTAARALQGAGGALLFPVGRLILLRTAPRAKYIAAASMLALLAQSGPMVGPPVGGFITTFGSWRWVFLINLPFGVAALVLSAIYATNFRPASPGRFDWIGFGISSISLSALIYGVELLTHADAFGTAAALVALGLAGGAALYWLSLRRSDAVIDFTLLRTPTFRVNITGGSVFRLGSSAAPFLLPLLFQLGLGMNPLVSGLLILVSASGMVCVRFFMVRIFRTFGFRQIFIACGLVTGITMPIFGFIAADTPFWQIGVLGLVAGLSQSLVYSGLNSVVYADLAPDRMGAATSLSQLSNQVTNTLAVAISAVVLNMSLAWHGETELSVADFRLAFLVAGVFVLASIPFFVRLDRYAGSELSGARRPAG